MLPSLAASEEARGRFLREGQAASRIRHPHVVDVTDVVAEGPISYLVMEYLEGEDLSALIERQGALALAETADVLLPVIAAISAAHELGVIHRDLKPENVFLARTSFGGPCPKVVDFGISKVLGDPTAIALTATSAVFGTMFYLPPEQLGGSREADARGDQYALGVILYECLTGHRAFEGTSVYGVLKNVAEGVYPPARSWRPDLPPRLEAVIDRAMRLNPAARFESVLMLGAELLLYASAPVRAVWAPVFPDVPRGRGGEAVEVETGPPRAEAVATARLGTGTMLLRASDESPAIESADDLRPPTARAPRIVAVSLAVVAVVAAIVSGVRRMAASVEPAEPVESLRTASAPVSRPPAVPPPPVSHPSAPASSPPSSPASSPALSPTWAPVVEARPAASAHRAPALRRRKSQARAEAKPRVDVAPAPPELRTNVPTIERSRRTDGLEVRGPRSEASQLE